MTYTYNRQLQAISMTDQAGTAHAYFYDKLGRQLTDTVTAFGTGVDTTVGKIETAYNVRGIVLRATSWNPAGTTKINEINSLYNAFNQLTAENQSLNGAPTTTALRVSYTYANGSANTIRPLTIAYPKVAIGGTSITITTAYTGAMADALSRPDELKESSAVLASWKYLGLGTLVGQTYNATTPDAEWTMKNGGTGDAGDPYTGLDRFGRLVETIWKTPSDTLVQSTYGRNRNGGVIWRRDDKAHAMSKATQDSYYWYDGLQQVSRHDRGELDGPPYVAIMPGTVQQHELFSFDETGNWTSTQGADPLFGQTRTQNAANEITALTNLAGPTPAVQPVYDPAGNMTTLPQPADWTAGYDLVWDAWNRLVEVNDGATNIATYRYDARSRRVKALTGSTTRDYYYDQQWRCIEERVTVSGTTTIDRQYTWSPTDRWTLIRRKRSNGGTLNETLYCLKDYLDPVAVIDTSADVVERYTYDAFGPVVIMDPDFDVIATSTVDWNFLFHAEFRDTDTGLYNYGYRYYHPQLGRWISRDPIGEQGGLNIYFFINNNPLKSWDILGLLVGKRDCEYVINAGHGWFPEGENKTPHPDPTKPNAHKGRLTEGAATTLTVSYLSRPKCGDRVAQVSCFGGDVNDWINKYHPDHAIPGTGGKRHDPNIPLWNPDGSWNVKQPGFLWTNEALPLLKSTLDIAVKFAEKECKNPKSCCKSITVKSNCLPGGVPDFMKLAIATEEGRELCNFSKKIECPKI